MKHVVRSCREKTFILYPRCPEPEDYSEKRKRQRTIQRWIEFDVALRNELVRIRAAKKHLEPAAYLRAGDSGDSSLAPAVMAATMNASLLDAEKILDEIRWKKLDELATGHYFDLDHLIVYAYKLLILQRWENVRSADGTSLLKQATGHLTGSA